MKKLIALMLLLALCISLLPCAYAEGGTVDPKKLKLKEYSWEKAREILEEISTEGTSATLKDFGLKFWRPNTLLKLDLTEEAKARGYVGYYTTEDGYFFIQVVQSPCEYTTREYLGELQISGLDSAEILDLNGLEAVTYTNTYGKEGKCRVVSLVQPDKTVLEFVIVYSTDIPKLYIDLVVASIRPA